MPLETLETMETLEALEPGDPGDIGDYNLIPSPMIDRRLQAKQLL